MSDILDVMVQAARKAVSGYPHTQTVTFQMRAALHALEQAGYAVVPVVPDGGLVGAAAMRFAGYWERIQKRPDDDESPEMMRMCEQRDGLIRAIRSLDANKLRAALDDSGIVGAPRKKQRKHPAADTAGKTGTDVE